MEFLVIGRYPLSKVRTMPVTVGEVPYSITLYENFTWQGTNPAYKEWTLRQGLLQAKDLYRLSPKTPMRWYMSVASTYYSS